MLKTSLAVTVVTVALSTSCPAQQPTGIGGPKLAASDLYGNLPLAFEPNRGQTDPSVRFLSSGNGYSVFLTDAEAVLALRTGTKPHPKTDVVRMRLIGASPGLHASPAEQLPGTVNYFAGRDSSQWRTGLPTYARIKYEGAYPGVDLTYYGDHKQLEYDFAIAPHADPSQVRLRFAGARRLRLNRDGSVTVAARHGQIAFRKPTVYQEANGKREAVEGRFVLLARNTVGFALGAYDRGRPVVIDPVLSYSTYLGNSAIAYAIAVDASGNTYVTGPVFGANGLPTTAGAFQPTYPPSSAGSSAFVTKLNATGTALIYSTYLGGDLASRGTGIAIDSQGNAYIAGTEDGPGFPVTAGALNTGTGCFVTKLNPTGTGLIYSALVSGRAGHVSIAVDAEGSAYVTAAIDVCGFLPTPGAFQTKDASGAGLDAVVAKLSPSGASLVYSTYLGGASGIGGITGGIAVDVSGNAFVTGQTGATDFPVTPGAYQSVNKNVLSTAFVTKVNPTGSALVYSTFLGGSTGDEGDGIAVDATGDAYVAGLTLSPDFPVTLGALHTTAPIALFVTKINPTGTALVYSAIVGGAPANIVDDLIGFYTPSAIALDPAGNAYLTGTPASGFPVTPDAFSKGGSMFVTILNASGNGLLYSTLLGGIPQGGIALDPAGNVYVAGQPYGLAATPGAFQTDDSNGASAFIAKFSAGSFSTVNAASFTTGLPIAPNSIATSFGTHLSSKATDGAQSTAITFTDSANVQFQATAFYISPTQVNFLVPEKAATGTAQLAMVAADGTSTEGPIQIAEVAPGIFTADGTLAVGAALQIDAQGNQKSQNLVQYNSGTGKFTPVPVHLYAVESPGASTYLILYGTGIRNAPLSKISISMGGQTIKPAFAGPQGQFSGEDQINFEIPKTLASAGDVAITLTAAGVASNAVHMTIQ